MPDSTDVVQAARDAFEDAHRNLDSDLAAAKTPTQAREAQDNHDNLLAKYMEALRTAFSCSNAEWEQALTDARTAQKKVEDARKEAMQLVQRIGAMTALTSAIANLVTAAK